MNGFTSDAVEVYSYSTPFITTDGEDFMAVLDRRIQLNELITHKIKHASQTGRCHLPVARSFLELYEASLYSSRTNGSAGTKSVPVSPEDAVLYRRGLQS